MFWWFFSIFENCQIWSILNFVIPIQFKITCFLIKFQFFFSIFVAVTACLSARKKLIWLPVMKRSGICLLPAFDMLRYFIFWKDEKNVWKSCNLMRFRVFWIWFFYFLFSNFSILCKIHKKKNPSKNNRQKQNFKTLKTVRITSFFVCIKGFELDFLWRDSVQNNISILFFYLAG